MAANGTTFFVGEFTHALDAKGRVTIPSKWRIQGGENTYLALPESEWLHHGVSAEDDRETRGEGGGSKLERSSGTISFNGTFFKSGFFWVRQAGENQSERQAFGARGNQGEGSLGWQVFLFCNLVGGSAKG